MTNRHLTYKTHGTCSQYIDIELNEIGEIENVNFIGGCDGNLKGICTLIKGRKASEVKKQLKGICCGSKSTSCPDQLALALEALDV
jgi:uncharacterized protein (TIGR03905 family)